VGNSLAQPTITAGGPTTFCQGGSVTLTAPAGFNYLWSTGATTQSITITSGGSFTVQTIANACTSAASAATVVTVNTPPSQPTIQAGGATTFCQGGSVTLTAPAGFNYLWSTGATTQSITVTSSGSFTVQTIAGACTSAASAATVVTVNTPPTQPTIQAGGATTFCQGGSVNLYAPSGFAYLWSNGATTQSITVTSSGSFTVQTIANACTSEASAATVVTVNTPPTQPTIQAGGATTFCQGGSVNLYAPTSAGYLWSNGATTQSITVTSGGSFTVQTIANACTSAASAATVVTVNPVPSTPTITASGATTFCQGGSVTLSVPSGLQTVSYLWSTGATTQSITVTGTGNYTVQTIAGTCTSAVSAITAVNVTAPLAQPTITTSGATTFCQGGSVNLYAPAGFSYLWSNGATTQGINVTSAGSFTVQTIAGACTSAASAATVVTVNPVPSTPTITASGATTFCQGGSVTLTAPAGLTYLWSNGATTQTIAATTSGSYTVQTISGGCSSAPSNAIVVTVNPIPATPTITASGPINLCSAGASVTLTSSAATGNLWSNSAKTQSITVTAAGSYRVRTVASACTSAYSAYTKVTVGTTPATPTINVTGSTTLCGGTTVKLQAPANFNYKWSTGATTRSITVSTAGSYTVQTIATSCTSAASAPVVVTVCPGGRTSGGVASAGSPKVSLFPNPVATGSLNLASESALVNVRIYTLAGVQVFTQELAGNTAEVKASLKPGTYVVEVMMADGTSRQLINWE
jgi:hypothetical protein